MNSIGQILGAEDLSAVQILSAIGIAYLGGILASLTPCVYPMIPVTVSVVGGTHLDRKPSWRYVLARSASYLGGLTVIYSFLGVAAGLTGRVFGTLTNSSAWYMSLGIVMMLAALIMLDVIPFDPITAWERFKRNRGWAVHHHPHHGYWGAFFLGASSGFIAAPCTTPVMTGILGFIAKTKSIGIGFLLMTSFSLGLSTLLLLVALFAGSIQMLPRSGHWMKKIKHASGMILLAFGCYLFYRAGQAGGL